MEDIDADTWRLGGEVWRVAGGHRYMEAGKRGMEGCWRTQIHGGWKEREGRMLEDMDTDKSRLEREIGKGAGGHGSRYTEAGRRGKDAGGHGSRNTEAGRRGRVAGGQGHRYKEAGRREREGCWRTWKYRNTKDGRRGRVAGGHRYG